MEYHAKYVTAGAVLSVIGIVLLILVGIKEKNISMPDKAKVVFRGFSHYNIDKS